jgi:heme A synthase
VHFAHRLLALGVLAAVVRLAIVCRRSGARRFLRLGGFAALLVVVQVSLGALTVLTGRAVVPTTAHVATGAALLGAVWLLTLRAFRHLGVAARGTAPAHGVPTTAGAA